MRLVHSLPVPECRGIDHMDFSADGRYAFASCEFAGRMIEIDLSTQQVIHTLTINNGVASPQDVKLSPDGRTLYTADQQNGGLWEINPYSFCVIGFLRTGAGAHGLYPSRDATLMYVANRQAGSISVVSFRTRRVVTTWQLPLPASPHMGGVSADGNTLWLSGRYNAVVHAIDTRAGRLRAAIPVGDGPHGLCVWPQPATHSGTPGSCANRRSPARPRRWPRAWVKRQDQLPLVGRIGPSCIPIVVVLPARSVRRSHSSPQPAARSRSRRRRHDRGSAWSTLADDRQAPPGAVRPHARRGARSASLGGGSVTTRSRSLIVECTLSPLPRGSGSGVIRPLPHLGHTPASATPKNGKRLR